MFHILGCASSFLKTDEPANEACCPDIFGHGFLQEPVVSPPQGHNRLQPEPLAHWLPGQWMAYGAEKKP